MRQCPNIYISHKDQRKLSLCPVLGIPRSLESRDALSREWKQHENLQAIGIDFYIVETLQTVGLR